MVQQDRLQRAEQISLSTANDERPRVLIIEDHVLVGQTLAATLRVEGFNTKVVQRPTLKQIEIDLKWNPELTLLDLDLGGDIHGALFLPLLRRAGTKVVIVTGTTEPITLSKCYDAGAAAVFEKNQPVQSLVGVLRLLLAGEDPAATARQVMAARARTCAAETESRLSAFRLLTGRESHVLTRMMAGISPHTIAEESDVSVWTVRTQIKSIFLKLGVNSQIAAVALARRRRMVR